MIIHHPTSHFTPCFHSIIGPLSPVSIRCAFAYKYNGIIKDTGLSSHEYQRSRRTNTALYSKLFEEYEDSNGFDIDAFLALEEDAPECMLPEDFNAISLKDLKCVPDEIDKRYWELLSTGADVPGSTKQSTDALIENVNYNRIIEDSSPENSNTSLDQIMTVVPIVSPFLAFITYPILIPCFDKVIDMIAITVSTKNWLNVDGGAYQAELITPAINGIVVPAVSILFATMISQTVTTLRQRQVDVRTCLNIEASEIRILQRLVESFTDSTLKNTMRRDLTEYTLRIISECAPTETYNCVELVDSEMNDFFDTLNKISSDPKLATNTRLLSEASSAVVRLNNQRSTRISALQTTFPTMHYLVLATLAFSICLAFLLETNQKALVFLATTELRFLWTMLIGAFGALAAICYDLLHPFRGNYQIVLSVVQFYKIRDSLITTEKMKRSVLDLSMSSSFK